ncbi:MAG: lipoyl(octanoyl) transferase LipB [Planctomycetes bacterium]|nr:lipoyl(octanoyl) transferase LipB [Planctomycetota bacterium]
MVEWLGETDYAAALEKQTALADAVADGKAAETLLLLTHPHTFTIGKNGGRHNLLVDEAFLRASGAGLYEVDRGGDITYHGPGQLVGYPILDLNRHRLDLRWYMVSLQEAIIALLAAYGVAARRREGRYLGVWVGERKIAALGVHARRWVTTHGFALNVSTDLSWFTRIRPCGITEYGVTSMQEAMAGRDPTPTVEAVAAGFAPCFAAAFGYPEAGEKTP